jgi:ATP adenylyltransferase/5',5'''-P-1,P-4-tetraphosphate phosphorylase II
VIAMLDRLIIPEHELAAFGTEDGLAGKANALLVQQKSTWELLRKGYASLNTVQTREFEFDGFIIQVQFNPGRLISTSAKVDDKSIRERRCFLCLQNLPAEQRGLPYKDEYVLLCNPFPILPEHFTIPHRDHIPQGILSSFGTLLSLSKDFTGRFTALYNGPKCGASAPDHLHLQAGTMDFMPIEIEYTALRAEFSMSLFAQSSLRVYSVQAYLAKFISFESPDPRVLEKAFLVYYAAAQSVSSTVEEPLMNIHALHRDGEWRVLIFPRTKHRPSFYFAEGDQKIMISPAAVDLGGVCTTPIEKDFEKITKEKIIEMFDEVSVSAATLHRLEKRLVDDLAKLQYR